MTIRSSTTVTALVLLIAALTAPTHIFATDKRGGKPGQQALELEGIEKAPEGRGTPTPARETSVAPEKNKNRVPQENSGKAQGDKNGQ